MILFRKLSLDDIPLVRPYTEKLLSKTCDYTVGTMFMWRNYFDMEIAETESAVFTRLRDENGNRCYNLPFADELPAAIDAILRYESASEVRFTTVPECYLPAFDALGREVTVEETEEYFDYFYSAEDLKQLKGKKYSPQRNLIHQFEKECGEWRFVPIESDNVQRVIDYFRDAFPADSTDSATEREDRIATSEVLEHLDEYKMVGGFLEADGQIVGFSLGETVGDTLYTHIEKADRHRKGAYQMLVNQFARHFADESIRFINREDDMGDPGLRRAKHAYHPIELLKKYTVTVK